MFKVMIIDDEPIIRKGLRNIINWKQFDCEVCGEASDGQEGIEMIQKLLPDIIFSDIRMPEVDGLCMIRTIRDLLPDSKIIILTGYRDFEYVQEAIKIGAFDFILKPSKIEELTAIISRAVKELKYHRDRSDEIRKLKSLFEQNMPVLRERFLYDVLYEINGNVEDILAKVELFKICIGKFHLVVVENEGSENEGMELGQYDKQLYQIGLINTFNEVFADGTQVTSISLNDNWVACILQLKEDVEDWNEMINEKSTYFQQVVKSCFGFTVSLAVSSEATNILELPLKFRECREALEHKFYMGNNSIIFYSDLNSFFKFKDFSLLEKYQKTLLEGIKTGNVETVKNSLADAVQYIDSMGKVDMEYMKEFYWNTISAINNIRISVLTADNEKNSVRKDISSLHKLIEQSENITELNGALEEISLDIAKKVYSFNNKSIKLVLRKAIDYLQNHYNEQVTLNEVAEKIYVSTYYISRMFKKELNKNFVDYLNEIRIEKARELLRDVKYKTYEIAEMVGIPDAHYFSKLFKKYEGMTPTEFRDSQK